MKKHLFTLLQLALFFVCCSAIGVAFNTGGNERAISCWVAGLSFVFFLVAHSLEKAVEKKM